MTVTSKAAAIKIAKDSGIDVDKMEPLFDSPEVEKAIQANAALGRELGISGTPAFVVAGELVPGAVGYETLSRMINEASK